MNPLITRVLLATDFSRCAEQALSHALAISSSWKAQLDVLHVLEFLSGMDPQYPVNRMYLEQLRKEASRQITDIEKRAVERDVPVRVTIDIGVPSQRIEAVAFASGADLIVMGTHGRTGLEHVLVGSTAERVVRMASRPVLSVKVGDEQAPQQAEPAGMGRFRKLLVPIDFSASSLEALEYGVQFAKQAGSTLTILHALEPVAYALDFTLGGSAGWREQKAHAEARLEVLRALCASNGVKADHVLKAGFPADSIREYAGGHRPDLIIMGTHGRRGVSRFVSGSVAEAMLRVAPCPVLTVRVPVFGAAHERIMPAGEGWSKADTQGGL
jgi:nucleotide-binding universal stress UspA family protein